MILKWYKKREHGQCLTFKRLTETASPGKKLLVFKTAVCETESEQNGRTFEDVLSTNTVGYKGKQWYPMH